MTAVVVDSRVTYDENGHGAIVFKDGYDNRIEREVALKSFVRGKFDTILIFPMRMSAEEPAYIPPVEQRFEWFEKFLGVKFTSEVEVFDWWVENQDRIRLSADGTSIEIAN